MKIIDCEQGTPKWIAARLGIPSASNFHRIITPAKGDLSKSAKAYAAELVAERLLSRPAEATAAATRAMERGKELEPFAFQQYEFTNEVELRRVGFVTTDDGTIGCSPDALIIGKRRGVEIKSTLDDTHMLLFVEGPGDNYKPQVQGCLAVAECETWDLYGYHPELPPVQIQTHRDEPYIKKMGAALTDFLAMRDEMLAKVMATGWFADRFQLAA